MNKPVLYMMLGYPGAGKTTTAQIIANLTGAVHISSDKMRMALFPEPEFSRQEHKILYEELDHLTRELLKAGKDVIYDANLNRYIHRKEKYDVCGEVGAKAELIWVQVDRKLAKNRAIHDSRKHLWPPDEPPDKMFDRLAGIFEPPKENEPYIAVSGYRFSEAALKKVLNL